MARTGMIMTHFCSHSTAILFKRIFHIDLVIYSSRVVLSSSECLVCYSQKMAIYFVTTFSQLQNVPVLKPVHITVLQRKSNTA